MRDDWKRRAPVTCSSSSMTSSIVIMPTASSSSFRLGMGVSLTFRMSESASLDRQLLLLVEPRLEFWATTGKLFRLFIGLKLLTPLSLGRWPSISSLTSVSENSSTESENMKPDFQGLTPFLILTTIIIHDRLLCWMNLLYDDCHVAVAFLELVQNVVQRPVFGDPRGDEVNRAFRKHQCSLHVLHGRQNMIIFLVL